MDRRTFAQKARRFAGELATIVLGILFALWIDGLAAERAARKLEAAYLASLESDLLADSVALGNAIAAAERQQGAATAVLDTLRGDEQPSPSFLMLLFTAGDVRQFIPQAFTLEELRATGNLRLLRDRELTRHVITVLLGRHAVPIR